MPLTAPDEVLAEAVSLVPWVHVPVGQAQRIVTVGYEASSAALVGLRFPEVRDVVIIGATAPSDARVRTFSSLTDLPPTWTPDLAVLTVPVVTPDLLRAVHLSPAGIVCAALQRFDDVVPVKALMRAAFRYITVYREYIGGEPALFLMGSNAPISRQRAMPAFSKRYTDKSLPNLFTFAKDEYQMIFGAGG